jgi:deoxyribose-phosphate aldolase
MTTTDIKLNTYIEHTLLKPYSLASDVELLCSEAIVHNFFGVCVTPYQVKNAAKFLNGTTVKLVTVVGFPFGYNHTPAKVEEVKKVIDAGADEIDMVMNIAALKSNDFNIVANDIESVAMAVHMNNKVIKVIIESGVLSNEEIIKACEICTNAGVNFVKTSTGYAETGATVEAVKLIRKTLPASIKIKASGGIKDKDFALQLIKAGADRIGTSSGIELLTSP